MKTQFPSRAVSTSGQGAGAPLWLETCHPPTSAQGYQTPSSLSLLQDSEVSRFISTVPAKSSQKIEDLMEMVKKLQKGPVSPL